MHVHIQYACVCKMCFEGHDVIQKSEVSSWPSKCSLRVDKAAQIQWYTISVPSFLFGHQEFLFGLDKVLRSRPMAKDIRSWGDVELGIQLNFSMSAYKNQFPRYFWLVPMWMAYLSNVSRRSFDLVRLAKVGLIISPNCNTREHYYNDRVWWGRWVVVRTNRLG